MGPSEDHRLRPIFAPASMAVVGASPRTGSVGQAMTRCILASGYTGHVQLINPYHKEIEGRPCLPSIRDMDHAPDLAVLNVGANRMESALEDVIAAKAKSAVIFDACHGETANGDKILTRIRDMARQSGLPICGGNAMGFFDVTNKCHVSFYTGDHLKPGGITLIAHSGSVFTVLALNDPRYRFDLVVSPGQEIGASIDEYMDYALGRPSTKVIALFMEEARNPEGFCAALARAAERTIPVVVCKVGRTEESARLARSHSGAMAGSNAAYEAVLDHYGAIRVSTVDQLMNVSMVLAQGHAPGPGGPALVTDSGGLREALIDRAAELNVPLARLSGRTEAALAEVLPQPLVPSNPQDCAGALADDFETVFEQALGILAHAEEVSMIGYEIDARDDYMYSPRLGEIAHELPQITGKPCFVYSSFSQTNNRSFGAGLADLNIPVINGADEMLSAVQTITRWSRRHDTPPDPRDMPTPPPVDVLSSWAGRLSRGGWIPESEGLSLISDFGLPVVRSQTVRSRDALQRAAAILEFPAVLKTAETGIAHKSDVGGVVVNIATPDALMAAYDTMCETLGPGVIVQQMVPHGVELSFGCIVDPAFGPLVMVSAGGTHIEIMNDRQIALAPVSPDRGLRMIDDLKISSLLRGARGKRAMDKAAVALALSRFSVLCHCLRDSIKEMDINPIIVTEDGFVAVDALVVPSIGGED